MEVVMLPQLMSVGGAGGGGSTHYRLIEKNAEGGAVLLSDQGITSVSITQSDSVRLVIPPRNDGVARDFLVRVTCNDINIEDSPPQVSFGALDGEVVRFEAADEDVLAIQKGANIFSFTETAPSIFLVARKQVFEL